MAYTKLETAFTGPRSRRWSPDCAAVLNSFKEQEASDLDGVEVALPPTDHDVNQLAGVH
jgi:hypothetical protein